MTKYLFIAIVVLSVSLLISLKTCRSQYNEKMRYKENFESVTKENPELTLNYQEFLKNIGEKERIELKKINVKPRLITRITYINITHIDTVSRYATVKQVSDSVYQFRDTTSFSLIKGRVIISDSVKVAIDTVKFKNNLRYIVYKDRRKWKLLFFDTKFLGKRIYKIKITSSNGDVTYKDINIK